MRRIATVICLLGLLAGTAGASVLNVNDYASIQAAINAASPGDVVYMPDGTYTVATTIYVNKGITLQGQSEAGTILDHTTNAGYAFNVGASDVVMEQFSIVPPDQNYPIHASGTSNLPDGFDNLTIQHLTIAGTHRRSGFDIHGYNHVILSHLTSSDAYGGNGVQVTGCVDVDMDNITTSNNAWGSIAIYCSSLMARGSSDVVIDGATLNVGEGWVFSQDEFGYVNSGIDIVGWEYIVRNETHRPDGAQYDFFADTAADAVTMALAFVGFESDSYAWNRLTGEYLVGPGMSLQTAIDQTPAGGAVTAQAGVYEEQLEIAKDITLAGEGPGTIIRSLADLPLGFNTGSSTKYAIVYVHDTAAPTIADLTVDGAGRGNLNYAFVGIGFWNAGGTVSNVHVTGVRDTPFSGAQHGVSIYAYNNTGGPYLVTLADVLCDDIQKNALALLGAGLTVDLDRVTTIGAGPTAVTAQNGIQISYGAGGTVDDCQVQGFHWTGATWTASGVLIDGAAQVTMTDVDIDASQTSGYFFESSVAFHGGTVTNPAGDGLLIYNDLASKSLARRLPSPFDPEAAGKTLPAAKSLATSVISGATVTGAGVTDMGGIVAYAYPGDLAVEITDCAVTGWDYGIYLYEGGGVLTGEAHGNTIAGNLSYGAASNTATPFDMTGNWWGHTSGPLHPTLNPLGQGNEVSDNILFDPWLGAGGLALLPMASGPIMCGDTVTLAFHYTPDTYTPPLRGYEVTFQAGSAVSFGAGDVLDSHVLDALGTPFFYVADNGDGTWTVTGAILGPTAGLTTEADLFSVTFHGAATGTALVEVTGSRLRDLDNDPIGSLTASATIEVDCTAPDAVTDIDAEPGHQKVVVSWTDPASDVAAVEVWRGFWHDGAGLSAYPEYDDLPDDVIPTRPASRAAALASSEWTLAGTVPPGTETFTDSGQPRGVYYYEVFAVDLAGNYGPPAVANDRATNYWLGDVYPAGSYDGYVETGDITVLGAAFATADGPAPYNNECDVGPTDTNGPKGIPLTDNLIDLEDLMIFALNYSFVGPSKALPAYGPPALAWAPVGETRWALRLTAACPGLKGLRLTVPLPEGVTADVSAGDLSGRQPAPVFLHGADGEKLDVNLAVMGAGVGFDGTGDLFVVDLSAPAVLASPKIDARGLQNEKLEATITGELPSTPAVFSLAQNAPNPFNPSTKIVFSLAETRPVRLAVYGVDGRLVRKLLAEQRAAGRHEVIWDGRDDSGRLVASGTYFCRIEAGSWLDTRKMVLMK